MKHETRWRSRRARLAWLGLSVMLAGCQTYAPQRLDLAAHARDIADRLEGEALPSFARRISERGGEAVEFDASDGLTSAEGEVVALFYNAELRLARLGAGLALATAETAGRWQDPEFGFDGAEVLSPGGPFEYGLTLALTIPVSGRLRVEKDRARAEHDAELRRVVDQEWRIRAAVRSAWAAWSAQKQQSDVIAGALRQAESLADIIDTLERGGELPKTEARMLRATAIRLRVQAERAAFDTERARLALFSLMGLPPTAEVELVPAIPAWEVSGQADGARLIAANTTLAVRRAEYQVAEQALRLEIRKQYPDITIGGGYGNEGDDRLLLGLSIPVPILNANAGGIARARAARDLARARAEIEYERLVSQLAAARAELAAARVQVEAFEAELIPAYESQAGDLRALSELGEVDVLLLLETLRGALEARRALLELRLAEAQASIEVARLLGPDQPPPPAPVSADVEESQP